MLSSPNAVLLLKLLFCMLALIAGGRWAQRAVGGMDSVTVARTFGALLAGAFVGAKLTFVAQFPGLVVHYEPGKFWMLAAGHSVPGALAGAWAGGLLAARDRTAVLADALTPALLLALLILDAGSHFWSLSEPGHGAPARLLGFNFGDGMLRHPVMWYDAACLGLMLWAHGALARHGVTVPGLRASVLWGAWFGSALLLAFLKPPFGPILLVEQVHPRASLYPPGLTAEQWLCVFAAGALAWQSVRILRASWRRG